MSRKRPHHGSRRRGAHPKAHKPRALIEGTLRIVRPGLAQVETAEGTFSVAPRGIREGMNGDEVQVSLVPMRGRGGERFAYVQGVLRRANTHVLGTYGFADPLGVVTPLDTRLAHDFFVLPEDKSAERLGVCDGDVVAARILEFPTRQSAGVVTIDRRLGSATELDVNVEAVIASYGITTEFPPAALEESASMCVDANEALAQDFRRKDLRDDVCITIDPSDARDFDDAIGAVRLPSGGYRVSVHIADVTHYVEWSSSIDVEARTRTCSVYLVDRVVPMLPERLCNDVCSLRPGEDRLAMTVCMDLDPRGRVVASEAFSSVIRSRARLAYDQVDEFLQHGAASNALSCAEASLVDVSAAIKILDEVRGLRESIRRKRGAIDFLTVESKVRLDENGHPVDVVVRERTRATGLVEEAMLMANESVAKMLAEHDVETAYRVHEPPSEEDLASCVPVLREFGVVDREGSARILAGDSHAIQDALDSAKGTSASYLASTLLLRAQKRAVYEPHNEGHYALGAAAYCHFTSPIRRYPDMLVHRALKWLLARDPVSRGQREIERALPQLCRTCSERERIADAAARASQRVKMAEFYASRLGESCSGIVVGCERFGLFVMLDDTCAEGFLPVRSLGDEWFAFDEERLSLTSESSGRVWRVGQRVAVEIHDVDVPKGRIDLALAGGRAGSLR